MFHRTIVSDVGLFRTEWRLGIVLQEKITPFTKAQLLALKDDLQDIAIAGEQPLTEFLLRLVPVSCFSRLAMAIALPIPVPNPQKA
jgi:hypothetical protein